MSSEYSSKGAFSAILFAIPVLAIVVPIAGWKIGIGAAICSGVLIATARTRSQIKNTPAFWLAVIISAITQLPFVVLIPWDRKGVTGIVVLPFLVIDGAIILGIFSAIDKLMNRPKS